MQRRNYRHLVAVALPVVLGIAVAVVAQTAPAAAKATCHAGTLSDFNGDGISDAAIDEPDGGHSRIHILYGTRSGLTASASGTALDDQLLAGDVDTLTFGRALAALDLNGDGCTDLAVGDPDAANTQVSSAGVVDIYLGSPTGLVSAEPIDESTLGEFASQGDNFGQSLAAGDVNGDGLADLIVGAPGETDRAGAIYIFPGDADGPYFNAKRFAQGDGIVPGSSEAGDNFGETLAGGDFNGDGNGDVVIGVTGENGDSGSAVVLRGSGHTSTLLTATGAQTWTQNSSGIPGTAEAGDAFGTSLAVGDFNGDHHADLAVGVPLEDVDTTVDAGTVDVIYGGASGLTSTGSQAWTQNSTGVSGSPEAHDEFGTALAAGDFNGNGKTDLAVGTPEEGLGDIVSAGEVQVLIGASGGLTGTGSLTWNQTTPGIAGTAEAADRFGIALTVLRVRSASRDDLVVGVPWEGLGSIQNAGVIHFIPGSGSGLTATGSELWSDGSGGVRGSECGTCLFGNQLA